MERMEDHADLPLDDLLAETSSGLETSGVGGNVSAKDAFVILVQPLGSGLLRIKMQGPHTK